MCIRDRPDTMAKNIYNNEIIYERHRHRYEVNNKFRNELESKGLVFSGLSPDEDLVEMIELKDHPYFVASQFHPEFKSSLGSQHLCSTHLLKHLKK